MKKFGLAIWMAALAAAASAAVSEIKVDLQLDASDFVTGERIRGVVDIANYSPEKVSVGYANSEDHFYIEVFRASDMSQLSRVVRRPFVSRFRVDSSEGQKLETFLADHFALHETSRYLARPVLVHRGTRYEGLMRAFDVVDGVKITGAMQMFANRAGLQREFTVAYWSRNRTEHLFLLARDNGDSHRRWVTTDLGPMLRLEKPSISVMPGGEVVVMHRINQDQFVRSEFWSMPEALEFRGHSTVGDPETAGTARVRELYKKGGVKAKTNPWWKFW